MKDYKERVEELLDEEPTELQRFEWTVSGEYYHEGSSDPWRPETQSGVIQAVHPATALIKLATGFGLGATLESTPDWMLLDSEREITLTLKPVDDDG